MSIEPSVELNDNWYRTSRNTTRWIVRETLGIIFLGVALFVSAGRVDWMMGWALVVITTLWVLGTAFVLIPDRPDLIAERIGPRKGAKAWDKMIMGVFGMTVLAKLIVAGLDVRFGWTESLALPVQVVALLFALAANTLVVWATAANTFFSQIVRIQEERGHRVATGGPYRFVRHPGYVGVVLFELATPILLGSLWALIPGGVGAILIVVRTALEDRTLFHELDGYPAYSAGVKYRLLPGVW